MKFSTNKKSALIIDFKTKWGEPPIHLTLPLNEIHIWQAELDLPSDAIYLLQSKLSRDELERASRFHFEKDRRRFIVSRGLLRYLLSRYLEVDPAEIEFYYGAHGKPELSILSNIQFNLSHSANIALYAFAQSRQLGIDIEQIRDRVDFMDVAKHFFSPLERAMLHQVPDQLVPQAFFNCWTRKEAYIKATGEGLSFPLDCFDVSLVPGEPAALINIRGSKQVVSQWSMKELYPRPEFAAALVVEGSGWYPHYWKLY